MRGRPESYEEYERRAARLRAITSALNEMRTVATVTRFPVAGAQYVNAGGVYLVRYYDGTTKRFRVERMRVADGVVMATVRGFNKSGGKWNASTKQMPVNLLAGLASIDPAPRIVTEGGAR